MFALYDIETGTEFFREAPLFPGGPWLYREAVLRALPKENRKQFFVLFSRCNCAREPCLETDVQKVFNCNAFEIEGEEFSHLYLIASRMNHDCNPNALPKFTKELYMSVRAVRDTRRERKLPSPTSVSADMMTVMSAVVSWGDGALHVCPAIG